MSEERKTIYLCLAHMSEAGLEQKYVKEAFDTNWVVPHGPNVNAFEEDLERFVNKVTKGREGIESSRGLNGSGGSEGSENTLNKQVVALSSGTSAVHLSLIGCGVKAGDEVCVQSFTFCASSHPITYLGAKPVFIGSEKDTWNMDPELLEKAIIDRKERTGNYPKAIIVVALYGMPYRIDRIMEIADKYGIPVIEDAAEGLGSRFNGQVLGTFGKYGVLSFNGNKIITTSGGGALICNSEEEKNEIMWYATQARDAYPYYQHSSIGYNYRLSNVCAGIGRGQMTVLDAHIKHHQHVQRLYEELLENVPGVHIHKQPIEGGEGSECSNGLEGSKGSNGSNGLEGSKGSNGSNGLEGSNGSNGLKGLEGSNGSRGSNGLEGSNGSKGLEGSEAQKYDSNFWLCTATIDPEVRIKGQENVYKDVIKTAVGGAAGVIHSVESAVTDCQPNDNVEALRVFMLGKKVECRPVWKPMHKQPVYNEGASPKSSPEGKDFVCIEGPKMACYTNGVEEELFKVGFCLPAGPYVTDDDVRYIVDCIKEAIS